MIIVEVKTPWDAFRTTNMTSEQLHVNLRSLFVTLALFIVAVIFGAGMLANGDPLWFLPLFDETPMRIVVYQGGCRTDLFEGDPRFDELTRVVNQTFAQIDGFNSTHGMSDESLKDYREKERAVELLYPEPVTIHSPYRFGHPDSIFVPLSGSLAEARSVFGGKGAQYWSGALRLKSIDGIQRAAAKIACAK